MYKLARFFLDNDRVLFLRADRSESGARNFKLREAKPSAANFGTDLYKKIFEDPKAVDLH